MSKLRIAGWSFVLIAVLAAIVGFTYQERAGGMMRSREAQSAGGVFLACLGAAGILLEADSVRRGVIVEEDQEVTREDRPVAFWGKVSSGWFFWALFVVVGLFNAIKVWVT